MGENFRQDSPPGAKDLEEWRRVIAEGHLLALPPEELVAALQDMGPSADKQVRNALAKALSDDSIRRLRRSVGKNHPNEGWDIIYRAHEDLFKAIGKPNSADGKGFREAYVPRLLYRLKDAIAKEYRERRTENDILAEKANKKHKSAKPQKPAQPDEPVAVIEEIDGDNEDDLAYIEASQTVALPFDTGSDDDDAVPTKTEHDPELMADVNAMLEQMDVNRLLENNIPNEKKRLAFRLFMDLVPFKSTKKETTHSIADVLEIDESTARNWIKEVIEILKTKVGAKND